MKASHRRIERALEDGARIIDYSGGEAKLVPVRLSGQTLFWVKRSTLDEMLRDPGGALFLEWRT